MKYKVTFSQRITQDETNQVTIEAESEKEAENKVKNLSYDALEVINANVIKIDNFHIEKIEKLTENNVISN